MSETRKTYNAAAFGAALEQMENSIEAIEKALTRLSDCMLNEKDAVFDAAEFRRFEEALRDQIDDMRAGIEIGDALLDVYKDCEEQVAEAVESLRLPI